MEENENKKILDEISKGAQMGTNAISCVAKKVSDNRLMQELRHQDNQYTNIINRVNSIYNDIHEEPKTTTKKDELMTWMGVQFNTMNDNSNSKISELLIQGTTMGIIEGRKLLNHKADNVEGNIKKILNDFVAMQEESVENLKNFL